MYTFSKFTIFILPLFYYSQVFGEQSESKLGDFVPLRIRTSS